MNKKLKEEGSLSIYESLNVTPEIAVDCFNTNITKAENKLSIQSIKKITKDIYYKVEINLLKQKSITRLVTSIWEPRLARWSNVENTTSLEYKNSTSSFIVDESKKTVNCPACNGKGKTSCRNCNGQGLILCPACRGNSVVETSVSKKSGVISRGLVGLVVAGPAGMILGGATGKSKTVTSSKVCTTCFGKGTIVCKNCSGSGIVTCKGCDGTGTLIQFQQIDVTNTTDKKDFEINQFHSKRARKETPQSNFEIEFQGDEINDSDFQSIPISEFIKVKEKLNQVLTANQDRILKFDISITSLPIFSVEYEAKGKPKEFKLVGSHLMVERSVFDEFLIFSPYVSWKNSSLFFKITTSILALSFLALIIYLLTK